MTRSSRREFLATAGALAASSCVPTATRMMLEEEERILVGAHPWVYAATRPNHEIYDILHQVFEDMSAAGMDFIELMHTTLEPDGAVERIGELSEKSKLPVIGTSYGAPMWNREEHERIFEYANGMIERLQALGARTIGLSVGNAGRVKTPDELDAQVELLRRIAYRASINGIVVNLHNHTYEVENNQHDLRGTLERYPQAKLGPDIGWLVEAGVDPVDFIQRYGSRIVYAHLRDRKASGEWSEAMGEGDIDYEAVGQALRQVNFSGDLAIELAHPRDFEPTRSLRESLRMSREYVRDIMGY